MSHFSFLHQIIPAKFWSTPGLRWKVYLNGHTKRNSLKRRNFFCLCAVTRKEKFLFVFKNPYSVDKLKKIFVLVIISFFLKNSVFSLKGNFRIFFSPQLDPLLYQLAFRLFSVWWHKSYESQKKINLYWHEITGHWENALFQV